MCVKVECGSTCVYADLMRILTLNRLFFSDAQIRVEFMGGIVGQGGRAHNPIDLVLEIPSDGGVAAGGGVFGSRTRTAALRTSTESARGLSNGIMTVQF